MIDPLSGPRPRIGRVAMSPDRLHRYLWEYVWDDTLPPLSMGALNPSTADENGDDPTVARMVTRARAWGLGSLLMWNAAAFRSKDPAGIYDNENAIGLENDLWIDRIVREVVERRGTLLYGWGAHLAKALPGRAAEVDRIVRRAGGNPLALRLTKGGHPEHPLYLAYALEPFPFAAIT